MTGGALAGKRIMVVEDEFIIAVMIEDVLIAQGCEIVGSYGSVQAAAQAAQDVIADAALLDVNLRGEKVFPVAEILEKRGIPFVLLSGYGSDAIPPTRPNWKACTKPFSAQDLIRALTELLEQPAAALP